MEKEERISIIKVPFFIIAFCFYIIELFPALHNIRTSGIWIIVTSSILSILFLLCSLLSESRICKYLYGFHIVIYWLRYFDVRIFLIIYGIYSLFCLIILIKEITKNKNNTNDSLYLIFYSMFSILIVLMQFIHVSIITERYFLKLLIPTLIISLIILGVFIYFAVKNNREEKISIKWIGLFLFGYIIIFFMVIMTLLTTNYLYDFKEPEIYNVEILEIRHHRGGRRSPSYYSITVEIDDNKEKIKVYDSYIEEYNEHDYVNVKVYQGVFNLKYTHVDLSFEE